MKLSLVEIANALATLVLVAILAWIKYREKRLTRAAGLGSNPERCEKHENSINEINMKLVGIGRDIQNMRDDISEIRGKLP
jgi:uncharacterized protein YaeQ